jgi:hypothetical protein
MDTPARANTSRVPVRFIRGETNNENGWIPRDDANDAATYAEEDIWTVSRCRPLQKYSPRYEHRENVIKIGESKGLTFDLSYSASTKIVPKPPTHDAVPIPVTSIHSVGVKWFVEAEGFNLFLSDFILDKIKEIFKANHQTDHEDAPTFVAMPKAHLPPKMPASTHNPFKRVKNPSTATAGGLVKPQKKKSLRDHLSEMDIVLKLRHGPVEISFTISDADGDSQIKTTVPAGSILLDANAAPNQRNFMQIHDILIETTSSSKIVSLFLDVHSPFTMILMHVCC